MKRVREKGIGTIGIVLLIFILISTIGPIVALRVYEVPKTVKVTGSTTVRPIVKEWRNEYMDINPDVRVSVSGGGSGQGVADVKSGRSDIGMSSSEILIDNEPKLIKHLIAFDGIMVVVNKEFPAMEALMEKGIKKSTLKKIYSGKIKNWKQVPGIDVDHSLSNYTRAEISGTSEVFANFLGLSQGKVDGAGQHGNAGTKEAVAGNKFSIGYIGAAYAFSGNIQEVPIDNNEDGELQDFEKIEDYEDLKANIQDYPIKRGLFLATKGEPEGTPENFINWCKTKGQDYVSEVGYVPIPRE